MALLNKNKKTQQQQRKQWKILRGAVKINGKKGTIILNAVMAAIMAAATTATVTIMTPAKLTRSYQPP
eukprot:6222300-Ditylum_brightwellii.AAC.1